MKTLQTRFTCIEEQGNFFLSLWPHRFDYIWAEQTAPSEKPVWQTESRHPLSDRLIVQGGFLYGVRFGRTTKYVLIDIDQGSRYHPAADPQALRRIQNALEPLGLPSCIMVTSSYSGGLHLYFPFNQPQVSWEIALGVTTLLHNAGLTCASGQLEVFPNPRKFSAPGTNKISLYAAHRLPLQAGSYILNSDLEPIYSSQERFAELWHHTSGHNTIDSQLLKQTLKSARRQEYQVTIKAEKFLNDLNAEIEPGWTGPGLTNRLLGRIAMRSYVFGHVLYAQAPLVGEVLVTDIVRVARELPGFYEWSNHVHEIEEKAKDWARAVEQSHYYPYGVNRVPKAPVISGLSTYNEEKAKQAREKIRVAIATLLDEGQLPITVKERFIMLTKRFAIGGPTLYKNKDLWHPNYLREANSREIPPAPPVNLEMTSGHERFEALSPESHPSLLVAEGCNPLLRKGGGDRDEADRQLEVCNAESVQLSLVQIREAIATAQSQRRQHQAQTAAAHCQMKQQVAQQAMVDRMKGYLASEDPILMGEALRWLRSHPEHRELLL
ncbi:hypothetical protein [Nodosilinea sp. E11]|uniref:hypothetical protein n=1 Tax=Nodosilinea sp. E11 TaxID=3037479 RepID=UPI00293462F6|nr:hypothetical protein [Nodosilinea sp. E11]WOD37144.1 hypothetical protein RRF56_01400 [Nodosilinea sp. E11]